MENRFEKKKLGEILKSNAKIQVPDYQRSFVWGKDEANNLIKDVTDSELGSFLGTVVFHQENSKLLTVVDGQQRLTSIFILLSALRRRSQELERHELAELIHNKIAHVNEATGANEGAKIEVSPVIVDTFNKTITERGWIGDFTLDSLKNKKREVKKIQPIYDEFWVFVKELDNKKLEVFLEKLYECYFGEIIIFDITAAFEIFERMNARGVELNAADLLKNHLFAELYESDIDVEKIWSEISDNAPGLLRMLRYYYTSRCGYVSYKKLFRKLKDFSNEIGSLTLLKDIQDFSLLYSVLYNPRLDALEEILIDHYELDVFNSRSRIKPLLRTFAAFKLFGVTQIYPLAMSLLYSFINESSKDEKDLKKLIKTFKNLENFLFVNHKIIGNPGNKVEKDFSVLAEKIYNEGSFVDDCLEINNYLKKKLENQDQFQLSFTNLSYESSNLSVLYYIFDRFTNYNQKGEEIIDIYDTDSLITKGGHNIEHIKPQSEKNDENIDIIDNIGNLILLSRHTNSSIGNKNYVEKISLLREKQTRLNIVREFIEKYGDQTEWSEEDIQNRATTLAINAYDFVWNIK